MSDSQTDPVLRGVLEVELYDQLRDIAAYYLRSERPDHTLQPTALANEAFIRMHPLDGRKFVDRHHFLAVASRVMRRVLVDYARARMADKRWGGAVRVSLTDSIADPSEKHLINILDIDAALTRLEATDPVLSEVVFLRFWAGLTEIEAAEVLGRSDRWVRGQWAFARAWLRRELEDYKLQDHKPLEDDKPLDD